MKGVRRLTKGELADRLAVALTEFVERVAKGGATPEEVQALPGIARVLADLVIGY